MRRSSHATLHPSPNPNALNESIRRALAARKKITCEVDGVDVSFYPWGGGDWEVAAAGECEQRSSHWFYQNRHTCPQPMRLWFAPTDEQATCLFQASLEFTGVSLKREKLEDGGVGFRLYILGYKQEAVLVPAGRIDFFSHCVEMFRHSAMPMPVRLWLQ